MNGLPAKFDAVMRCRVEASLNHGAQPFILEWTNANSKTPRQFKINGVQIGWCQHGLIAGVNGEDLGTYDRLVEFGGPDHDQHAMFVIPKHGPWCNWLPEK